MYIVKSITVLACFVLMLVISADAESSPKPHQLGVKIGIWNQITDARTEVSPANVATSVGSNGFLGGLSYDYRLTDGLALNASIGVMMADVSSEVEGSEVSSGTSMTVTILMGVKRYFAVPTYGSSIRPYAKAGIGPFVGSQSRAEVTRNSIVDYSRTEVAFGGQIGAGVDFVLSPHFASGLTLGYNLIADYNESIGGSKNYSGPELSLGFCYLFAN
jgi:hypothetical protein